MVFNVGHMLEGFERLHALADHRDNIIPVHDPQVMHQYPAPAPQLQGIAVRLDAERMSP